MGKKAVAPLASGVYAALATPRPQNSVEADAAALFDYIDAISSKGVDGLVLFGSTGEFVHFDVTERMRVLVLAKKRCRIQLMVGSDLIYRRARPLGAHGIVSGVAAALPELLVALDRAMVAKDEARTDQLDARLHEFLAWLNKFPATIGIKLAASARGWKVG